MSFWKWIAAYWKGYTVVIATPEKHYKIKFLKGRAETNYEIPERRGLSYDYIFIDEEPGDE